MPNRVCPDQPLPTVQLLHELPDGSSHVDWMLGQDPQGVGKLVTFRLPERLEGLEPGQSLDAEMIGEHRSSYLSYEGPVSGNRGFVRRLGSGRIESWEEHDDCWTIRVTWETGDTTPISAIEYRVERIGADIWRICRSLE